MKFLLVLLSALALSSVKSEDADATAKAWSRSDLRKQIGAQFHKEIHEYMAFVNRPYVKSFTLSDGSIVDCVRHEDQLALQHPLLKNHEVQLMPSVFSKQSFNAEKYKKKTNMSLPWQRFHHECTSCPEGTIPVQRLLLKDIQRMESIQVMHTKHPTRAGKPHGKLDNKDRKQRQSKIDPPAADGHQYAIVQAVGSFSGSQAYLSVWDPAVASTSDFSLSQLWLGAGSHESINTVEAGWQVYELLNGDRDPHLFIFWTADSYKASGCYNLRCAGFVQTSSRILLGGSISTISSPDASLYFKKFVIFKDPTAWWLQVDNEWIGYWPSKLFTTLGESSQWMQWGGEVCLSGGSDQPQLTTQMGSGFFPREGYTRAASQCELSYLDGEMNEYEALDLAQFSTDPDCYSASTYYDENWGSYVVFGGTGCKSSQS